METETEDNLAQENFDARTRLHIQHTSTRYINMSIIRHRSSDRLSTLLLENDDSDSNRGDVGPAAAASPTASNKLKVNVSAPNLMISTIPATTMTTSLKKSTVPHKTIVIQFSSAYRLLFILGALAILHIKLSSTNSVFTMERLLEAGNAAVITRSSSSLPPPLILLDDGFDDSSISVDIVSVGSFTKSDFQKAQEDTFRTHPSVRNFYRITELNDTDTTCHTDLTLNELEKVVKYCKNPSHRKHISDTSWLLRRLVYHPKNHTGWLCAQKRPMDGLYSALQQYVNNNIPIPNYLFIIDDDTYINMNLLMETLEQNHTEASAAVAHNHLMSSPQLVTGCRFNYPQREHFLFPFGGFSTIMSRTVIRNLIQPIHCSSSSSSSSSDSNSNVLATTTRHGFVQSACWRLKQNLMGELQYFRDGMSIGDLMYVYAKQLSFTEVDSWKNGQGFCFHSDHALGYFFGYYHIAVPDEQFTLALHNSSMYETMRYNYGYVNLAGPPGGCKHFKNRCTVKSKICHYIPPQQMHNLFRKGKEAQLQEQQ